MKISILGCGWLGFPLALQLVKAGYVVKGASRNSETLSRLEQKGIQPYYIDLQPTISGPKADDFFDCNLLIFTVPPGRRRADVGTFYPKALRSAIDKALEKGCQNCIFTSTTGVYGDATGIVDENSPLQAVRPSSKAVITAENLLLESKIGNKVILRLAGLAGPDRHPGKWPAGKTGLSNGDAPINLVHQVDVVNAIVQVIRQNTRNEILNLCAAQHPSKSEYYPWAARQLGLDPPQYNLGGADGKIVDSSKIRRELQFDFQYDDPYDFLD